MLWSPLSYYSLFDLLDCLGLNRPTPLVASPDSGIVLGFGAEMMVVVVMAVGILYSTDLAHTRCLVRASQIKEKYSEVRSSNKSLQLKKVFLLYKVRSIPRAIFSSLSSVLSRKGRAAGITSPKMFPC